MYFFTKQIFGANILWLIDAKEFTAQISPPKWLCNCALKNCVATVMCLHCGKRQNSLIFIRLNNFHRERDEGRYVPEPNYIRSEFGLKWIWKISDQNLMRIFGLNHQKHYRFLLNIFPLTKLILIFIFLLINCFSLLEKSHFANVKIVTQMSTTSGVKRTQFWKFWIYL